MKPLSKEGANVVLVEETASEWLIRLGRATAKLRIEDARLDGGDVLIPIAEPAFAELALELATLAAALAEHDAAAEAGND